MNGLLSMIGMQTELDYLIGDLPACFGDTPLAIPKGNIPSNKQKCQSKEQHKYTIKGIKIMVASKKDAIKKYNHHKKVKCMEQKYIKGDIVMYDNKIHTIMDKLELNNYELSYIEHPVHQLELSGVLLTPEILEKNGWDFIGYKMDFSGSMFNIYSKHDILPDLYYYYATKDFLVSICGKVVLPNMKYVHELQHLLFGLRLNSEMEV